MIRLRDLRVDTPTGVPCIEEQILAMSGRYILQAKIDAMLSERDQQSKIGLGSRTGGGSGSGEGADDHEGEDDDVGGDDDEGH
ncbi:hypothetical protein Tco_1565415 [Tanacetum coccineum]